MKKIVPVIIVLALTGAFFFFTEVSVRPAPALTMTSLEQQQIHTTQRQGKSMLVTFWATSCSSCIKEMPHLIELQNRHSTQVDVVGVAMFYDNLDAITTMVKRRSLNYPIVFDKSGEIAKAFGGIRLTPTSFLVSPDGHIVYQKIGDVDFKQLEQDILQMQKTS